MEGWLGPHQARQAAPPQRQSLHRLTQIFEQPQASRSLDDYYEPWTYDYDTLISSPPMETAPVARPKSMITGKDTEIRWGANWDDDLGGTAENGHKDPMLKGIEDQRGLRLREGLHVLPAAHLRALPQPVVRRLLPVGRDVQAVRGRHRARRPGQLPRLAHVRLGLPVQEGLLQPPHRQGREVHDVLPAASRSVSPTVCSETCVGPAALPRPLPLRRRQGDGRRVGRERAGPLRGPARPAARPE